ncbi:hypothetical protein TVAG_142180 [Trichomonas vaginalis G3]|uniref:Uncharacterized protein n=1 Tax=Trichomonas vaginalis (strain ATCC PRA-98 / G3) TaxID=412133 RepID=A2EHH7_TRIV3|nr:spectrin binding [Trichomonas vaginalis G3]EAY07864.1 hypothetical protein TVAG_142180 [Trichomonas vaginalis G3]KAI5514110.1 spectrin binding [Trichomonas vaginalis G3]|eukprot:XP_001320087.1 hypothetical protein [Trichomonas vaginalis G3]
MTPLILAVRESSQWGCDYLLEIGADPTIKDNRGNDYYYYINRIQQFAEEEEDFYDEISSG